MTARRAFPVVGITEARSQSHRPSSLPPGFPAPVSLAMGPAQPSPSTMCPPSFDHVCLQSQSPEGESDWMSLVNEHVVAVKQGADFGPLGAGQWTYWVSWKGLCERSQSRSPGTSTQQGPLREYPGPSLCEPFPSPQKGTPQRTSEASPRSCLCHLFTGQGGQALNSPGRQSTEKV